MKKVLTLLLTLCLVAAALSGCGAKEAQIKIAVPNDSTNEARALRLLEKEGLITLNETGGELATKNDIAENPYNIEIVEAEAAQLPMLLADVSYAVINSNYAIEAGLSPFTQEGTDVSYPNVLCVKEGNEATDKTKALIAALSSEQVKSFIEEKYKGAVVCDLTALTDGFDASVDYEALAGQSIKVAASPMPHAEILAVAKEVLAEKNVKLEIVEYVDYIVPNEVVESGEADANYFAHIPYQQNFNEENGTHLAWVLEVHHEPMGCYSNSYSDWSALTE